MNQQTNKIECPNCGHKIDVNDILYHQVDGELRKKYSAELAREKDKYQDKLDSLNEERKKLEGEKKRQDEAVADAIKAGLKEEEKRLQAEIRARMEEEQSERIRSLQEELDTKIRSVKGFNKAKSEIERLKREKDELKGSIEAESEKKLSEMIGVEKERIRKNEEQKSQLRLSEKEKIIEQLSERLKEAQRKAEQGSSQLQGEVQELAIEEWLSVNFPLDTIEE